MILRRLTIIITFLTAWVWSNGQQINAVPDYVFRNQMSVGRNAVTDTAAYFSIGPRYGANKGFMPPIVGDTATFSSGKRNGLLIFSVQKNKFLYWDSVRVQWSDMAGSSGSYITGSGITGYLPQFSASTTLDTSALFTLGNRLGIGSSTFAYNSTNTANVELNGTAGGILGFKRNDSARGYLWHTGDNMELANTAAGSIFFNTNSATRGSISSAGVWRLHNLAGTGDRVVVASSNGTLSAASSATALVDTTTISTRAWRQKGLDSLAALEVSGSGTTNYIPKFTAGSTIGNSQIFDNGTNVGLGTASPGAKFHLLSATGTAQTQGDYANNVAIMQGASRTGTTSVGGSFATTLSLQSNDDVITAGSGASIGFAAKWNTGLYSSAAQFGSIFGGKENSTDANLAGYLSFATRPAGGNPTERLRITSGGNVGIGDASPTDLLVVNGRMRVNGTNRITFGNNSGGYAGIGVTGATTGNLTFNTFDGTSDGERLRIFANGRIGINTTTDAGYQLDVNGTARINNALQVNKSDGGQAINIVGNNNTASIQQNGSDMYFNSNTNTTGGGFFFRNSSSFTTRMAIDANGNVGIGTTSPANKLSINGAANALTYFLVDNSQTYLGDNGIIGGGAADGNTALSWFSTKDLYFKEGSSTRMTIKTGGNVGIGTASPLAVTNYTGLTLSGTNGSFTSLYTGASQIARIEVNTTSDFTIKSIANVPLILGTNNTENVRITTSGNVGIGLTPAGQVGFKTIEIGGTGVSGLIDVYQGTSRQLRIYNSSTDSYVANNANGGWMIFRTTTSGGTQSNALSITDASELLVNTSTDAGDYKLQVAGNIYGSGLAVIGNAIINTNSPFVTGANIYTNGQSLALGTQGANLMSFFTNNAERGRINSAGEWIIDASGTDAGDYKLQVVGNARVGTGKLDIVTNTAFGLSVSRSGTDVVAQQINNSTGILYYGAESSTGGALFTGSSAYAAVIGSGAAYPLQFATDNVTRATINTNGELLINTLTDNGDFKLQVNGSALISGSIQTANPVSGTAVPWRLGSVVATNVQLDTGNYVEVNINGTFYRLAIVTPL